MSDDDDSSDSNVDMGLFPLSPAAVRQQGRSKGSAAGYGAPTSVVLFSAVPVLLAADARPLREETIPDSEGEGASKFSDDLVDIGNNAMKDPAWGRGS